MFYVDMTPEGSASFSSITEEMITEFREGEILETTLLTRTEQLFVNTPIYNSKKEEISGKDKRAALMSYTAAVSYHSLLIEISKVDLKTATQQDIQRIADIQTEYPASYKAQQEFLSKFIFEA
ncbi:MAG: hypothetical protein Q9M91_07525 [Candidatus Dojkabacteria bacterium]|nr:hypothetical protein [Candidatus Dojkabacteria bacterium]MDQ7021636.1 hypothetical protein [Candidatus Dojkabacteria bacterium]